MFALEDALVAVFSIRLLAFHGTSDATTATGYFDLPVGHWGFLAALRFRLDNLTARGASSKAGFTDAIPGERDGARPTGGLRGPVAGLLDGA